MTERVAVFDLWGDYAHFRKYYANMSPLTFLIPPRTVLAGIMGAIIGSDRTTNPELFSPKKSFLSIKILSEPQRKNFSVNFLKTNASRWQLVRYQEYKQTMCEFLAAVSYRVYFYHQDEETYAKAVKMLTEHKSYYTVSLGVSECPANFRFLYESPLKRLPESDEFVEVNSIIDKSCVADIEWEPNTKVFTSKMPYSMNNDREVTEYREYLFEATGKALRLKTDKVYRVEKTGELIATY